jgi:hypothetical protein
MTAADSQRQRDFFRNLFAQAGLDSAQRRSASSSSGSPYLLRNRGALGTLLDGGKEQGLLNMSGSQ